MLAYICFGEFCSCHCYTETLSCAIESADSVEMGNGSAAAHSKDEGTEDQIIGSIGEWGRWQAKWFLVLCCVALPSGFPRYTQ